MEEKKIEEKAKINGFNIASLVLGIVSLVTWCMTIVSIPCAILALVFGILGVRKPGKGMAIAGLITSGISILIWVIVFNIIIISAISEELDYRPNYKYCDCYDCDCYDYSEPYKGVYNVFTEKFDLPNLY